MKTVLIIISFIFITLASASVVPIAKNVFLNQVTGKITYIESDFVLIVLDDLGVGRFYYVDSKHSGNTVIWSYRLAAGRSPRYTTKPGIYKIYHRKEKWMSTKYPDESGVNNMNYSMFFNGGVALHQGSIWNFSHGCVHLRKKDAKRLFNITAIGTPVIVTNQSYIPFLDKHEKSYIFQGNIPEIAPR